MLSKEEAAVTVSISLHPFYIFVLYVFLRLLKMERWLVFTPTWGTAHCFSHNSPDKYKFWISTDQTAQLLSFEDQQIGHVQKIKEMMQIFKLSFVPNCFSLVSSYCLYQLICSKCNSAGRTSKETLHLKKILQATTILAQCYLDPHTGSVWLMDGFQNSHASHWYSSQLLIGSHEGPSYSTGGFCGNTRQ